MTRPITALLVALLFGCASDPGVAKAEQVAHGRVAGAAYGTFCTTVLDLVFGSPGALPADNASPDAASSSLDREITAKKEKDREQQITQKWDLHQREKKERQQAKRDVGAKIGAANAEALVLFFDCRRDEAREWIEQAYTAKRPEYQLAALWLECLMALDSGDAEQARYFYSKIARTDPSSRDKATIEVQTRRAIVALRKQRTRLGRPEYCSE